MPFFTGERSIMIFSSLPFLFFYLVAVLAVYKLSPLKLRNLILLVVSLFFYGWGEPVYILIMLLSIVVDYVHGMLVERWREDDRKARRAVASSVFFNLAILVFFKYWDFLAGNLNALTGLQLPVLGLPLPIGISFYTFQTMSYTIDVYRQDAPVQKDPIAFGAYVTLFPQLIAGPIVRYKSVADQLEERREDLDKFVSGIRRFTVGAAKKVLLANAIGQLWDQSLAAEGLTAAGAWLGLAAYAFQIYFDFSGYSDMAIGIALLLGYRFKANFNAPFKSQNPTEFWRRWHISLSSWLRDYIYIPLGGNRHGKNRQRVNLMATMLIGGIWHGASWMYLLWGAYHGLLLVLHKAVSRIWHAPAMLQGTFMLKSINVSITLALVVVGFTFFRASGPDALGDMAFQILNDFRPGIAPQFVEAYMLIVAAVFTGYVMHFMPRDWTTGATRTYTAMPILLQAILLTMVLFMVIQTRQTDLVPFIYLQY